jgi:hypothetical protein
MRSTTILLVVLALLCLWLFCRKSENYRFLGGMYNPKQGGYRAELNEECLQLQDGQQCMLTDGTSGNCVQSGHCVADMMIDLNIENQDVKKPYCTEPVFKEGCERFAKCKLLQGAITAGQLKDEADDCRSWFSPL